ncbi:hypothetical protein ANRL3_01111 [Anaerolineae bacterium]|nr:hypothetical protein ANRL3_01111 [Anaerolineae bacterium]
MGIHVSLPPTVFSNLGINPASLLIDLYQYGLECTRIDLAADDLKGILNLDVIETSLRAHHYVSRWDKWDKHESFDKVGSLGVTYYLGSRSSAVKIRIYDKAAERRAAGEDFKGLWIRVEIELHKKRAHATGEHIVAHPNNWSVWAAGIIKGYVDFKLASADSNKSRWLTTGWWDEFLGFAAKERITFSVGIRTVEDLQRWYDRQLAQSMKVLQKYYGKEKFAKMIASPAVQLKEKHRAMLELAESYKRHNGRVVAHD